MIGTGFNLVVEIVCHRRRLILLKDRKHSSLGNYQRKVGVISIESVLRVSRLRVLPYGLPQA